MKPHHSSAALAAGCALVLCIAASASASPIPDFDATELTGQQVHSSQLIGQPTILIVTPSRDASDDTRAWAEQLPEHIDKTRWRIRAVLAIDLPFFMDTQDALSAARDKIPKRYQDQTWLTSRPRLEKALGIPTDSDKAFVLVLDAQGEPVVQVSGAPTAQRLRAIESAARSVLQKQ